MGIGNYFKAGKEKSSPAATPQPQGSTAPSSMSEKQHAQSGRSSANEADLLPPTPRFSSRPASVSDRRSLKSNNSSMFLDDIKHEVMVNYLYQQQCSHLWVSDGSGEIEGVVLRKTRGQYMACPPQLGSSPFAAACAALNVQVCIQGSPGIVVVCLCREPC